MAWERSFGAYRNKELRHIKFRTIRDFEFAIRLCWSDSELRGLPRGTPDGRSLFVPMEAVEIFRKKGFKIIAKKVLSPEDISREELASMRRKHGM